MPPTSQEEALSSKAKAPSLLARLTSRPRERDRLQPLYRAIVAAGRDPYWYRDGQVPDSVQGRFDLIAAIMAIVMIRFEAEAGEAAIRDSVLLTELFVEDMDESLHQIGVGDYSVGKHVGKMMSALGGRLAAFRQAAQDRDFEGSVRRNIYHEAPPSEAVVAEVAARLERFDARVRETEIATLVAEGLPTP